MINPSKESVDQMANLMRIMNGDVAPTDNPQTQVKQARPHIPSMLDLAKSMGDGHFAKDDIPEVKNHVDHEALIALQQMNASALPLGAPVITQPENVSRETFDDAYVVDEPVVDIPYNDVAMTTTHEHKTTDDMFSTVRWVVKEYKDGNSHLYDVVNTKTNESIATDISLLVTAEAITELLNKRVSITNSNIRRLMELEEMYSRSMQDATIFRVRARQREKNLDHFRAAIAEDRCEDNLNQAKQIRDKIIQLVQSIGLSHLV